MPKSRKKKTAKVSQKESNKKQTISAVKSPVIIPKTPQLVEPMEVVEVEQTEVEVEKNFDDNSTDLIKPTNNRFNVRKLLFWLVWVVLFVVAIVCVDLLVQYMNNDMSIAVVNGKRLTKDVFYARLEKLQGQTVSDSLIKEEIVAELANKDKVSVSDFEIGIIVNYYINKLGSEKDLNDALTSKGWTMSDLRDDIRRNLLEEKVATKDIAITDEELQTFFDQYKAQIYPSETDPKFAGKKEEIKVHYIGQKFQEVQSTWQTSYQSIYDSLRIQNNFTSKPNYGFMSATINAVQGLYEQVKTYVEKK